MDLVSVIITTYKRMPNTVLRAVKSVLSQDYVDIELIIVDDSPESFAERRNVEQSIKNIDDSRVRYIKHDRNLGACAARNTGINNAKGKIIAFLDDDDAWHSDKISKQILKLKSGKYGLVYCKQQIINEINNTITIPKRNYKEGQVFDDLICTNFIGSTSFVMVKKECFENVGKFNTDMPAAQDLEMWLRIARKYEVGFVDEVLVDYYIHGGESITGIDCK